MLKITFKEPVTFISQGITQTATFVLAYLVDSDEQLFPSSNIRIPIMDIYLRADEMPLKINAILIDKIREVNF